MHHDSAFAFTAAWSRGGQVRMARPLPPALVRRLLRSAQLEGVRHGFLAPADGAEAWLAPAGGTVCSGPRATAPVVADALAVVVRAGARTFARELAVTALLPWARGVAAAAPLPEEAATDAGEPWDLWLVAERGADLAPGVLPAFRFHPAADDIDAGRPLQPANADAGDLPMVVAPAAIEAALAWCRTDPGVERAGVMLGSLALSPAGEAFVTARHFSPAVGAEEQPTSVRFTREAWAAIHRHRCTLDPALQVVAWVHSHPRVDLGNGTPATAHFLSADDVAIMAGLFDPPHCTAWVVDASDPDATPAESMAVFGWDRAGVGLIRRGVDVLAGDTHAEESPT